MESVATYKLDADRNEQAIKELGISVKPSFLFFKNGEKVDQVTGARPKELRVGFPRL